MAKMKVLLGMAFRQATGSIDSLLRQIGLDLVVPDFRTLSRRQKALKVNIPYRGSDGPLTSCILVKAVSHFGEHRQRQRQHLADAGGVFA
jgi:hypothetical protein